jgi:hypothetical protein
MIHEKDTKQNHFLISPMDSYLATERKGGGEEDRKTNVSK